MSEDANIQAAGEGLSDEEFARQVADQTANDLKAQDVFEREADGATTDDEIAHADADDLDSEK